MADVWLDLWLIYEGEVDLQLDFQSWVSFCGDISRAMERYGRRCLALPVYGQIVSFGLLQHPRDLSPMPCAD